MNGVMDGGPGWDGYTTTVGSSNGTSLYVVDERGVSGIAFNGNSRYL